MGCVLHVIYDVLEGILRTNPKDLQKDKKHVKKLPTDGLDMRKNVTLLRTGIKDLAGKNDKTDTRRDCTIDDRPSHFSTMDRLGPDETACNYNKLRA